MVNMHGHSPTATVPTEVVIEDDHEGTVWLGFVDLNGPLNSLSSTIYMYNQM
jgi:hypothetical protein